ncbi:MAG TPA: HIT family protein [Candidatus Nanoarchaeia archaeon]|nr:HIT family protein [Candidatus Nanoarchaeia archaeon]
MVNYSARTEEGKCIFCEIASGRMQPMSGGKFWESKKYIAWLSPFPNTEGFTVVIPKKHYPSDVLQMPDKDLKDFILEAKKIAAHLVDRLDDVGRVGLIMEGTGIDHAHIKLVPFKGTGYMKKGEWRQVHSAVNTYFEKYEGWIASNDGPRADEQKIRSLAEKLKK